MNHPTPAQHSSSAIRTQAAEWFAKLHSPACSEETRQEFSRWLQANPQHELAYEQCRTLWLISDDLRGDADLQRELDAARQGIAGLRTGISGKIHSNLKPRWRSLGQIAAAILVALVFVYTTGQKAPTEYTTYIGEQRIVQLADGSSITLNTNTKLSVDYNRDQRLVHLHHGEAYFNVSKDPSRPFEVMAGKSLVRAVGTEFNVALLNQAVNVDVAEGVVEFEPVASSPATKLEVGDAVKYRSGDNVNISSANLARVSAWQIRKIYFDNNTLADAVEEYNRYTLQKITVVDSELNQQRITGIFHVGDVDSFIFSLEQGLDARVVRKGGLILVMKKLDTPQG